VAQDAHEPEAGSIPAPQAVAFTGLRAVRHLPWIPRPPFPFKSRRGYHPQAISDSTVSMPILRRLVLSAAILAGPCLADAFAVEYYMRNPQQAAAARNGNGISNVAPQATGSGTGSPAGPTDPAAPTTTPSQPTLTRECNLIFEKANIYLNQPVDIARIEWSGGYQGGSTSDAGRPSLYQEIVVGDSANNYRRFTVPVSLAANHIASGSLEVSIPATRSLLLGVEGTLAHNYTYGWLQMLTFRVTLASGQVLDC
jgi:hypothetical protein